MNDWMVVDSAALARVHSGVMGRIRRRRFARRAAVVAAALLTAMLMQIPVDVETITWVAPRPPAAPEWVAPVPEQRPVMLAKSAGRPAERITIFTDDPNVVIVLVGEGGDE
jgi:hypothetical protein